LRCHTMRQLPIEDGRGLAHRQERGRLRADGGLSGPGRLLPGAGAACGQPALPERHA
jgi:hypothetical protein